MFTNSKLQTFIYYDYNEYILTQYKISAVRK